MSDSEPGLRMQIESDRRYIIWTSNPDDGDGVYDAGDWNASGGRITFTSSYLVDEPWTRDWAIVGDTLVLRDGSSENTYSRMTYEEWNK
ncbi:MAG: hypothetical protein Q7V53_03320 [Caldisericota bacterium]|nr:hypothetical protein [Caldisericota bacterium]